MKQQNINFTKPVAILQWNSIIAVNLITKKSGVKRGMSSFETLEVHNDMIFLHAVTIVINKQTTKSEEDTSQQMISTMITTPLINTDFCNSMLCRPPSVLHAHSIEDNKHLVSLNSVLNPLTQKIR